MKPRIGNTVVKKLDKREVSRVKGQEMRRASEIVVCRAHFRDY